MKKIFVLSFLLAAAMGFGCAVTNYELIVDNDQGGVVNTNGKAYIRDMAKVATLWPDGTDSLFSMVDQAANGNRTLTTYNYSGTEADPTSIFLDDKYCSPDWNGCAIATADDPEVGDVDDFDYRANVNCAGYRSLSLLVSATRYYYGECGRTAVRDRTMKLVGLANEMTPVEYKGAMWLRTNLSAMNTSLVLNNRNGSVYALPMTSQIGVMLNLAQGRMIVDMTNPNNRSLVQSFVNWNKAHPGPSLDAKVTVSGVSSTFNVKATKNMDAVPQIHY